MSCLVISFWEGVESYGIAQAFLKGATPAETTGPETEAEVPVPDRCCLAAESRDKGMPLKAQLW